MDDKVSPGDVKVLDVNEKALYTTTSLDDSWTAPDEWHQRLVAEYTGQHDGKSETLPAGSDPERVATAILTLNEEESLKILKDLVKNCHNDYTIDHVLIERCKELLEGSAACELGHDDWAYVICKTAGTVHNWSPYAEVRAVTLPYDDPEEPCESIRAYVVGFFWVCVASAVNTCKLCDISSQYIAEHSQSLVLANLESQFRVKSFNF